MKVKNEEFYICKKRVSACYPSFLRDYDKNITSLSRVLTYIFLLMRKYTNNIYLYSITKCFCNNIIYVGDLKRFTNIEVIFSKIIIFIFQHTLSISKYTSLHTFPNDTLISVTRPNNIWYFLCKIIVLEGDCFLI